MRPHRPALFAPCCLPAAALLLALALPARAQNETEVTNELLRDSSDLAGRAETARAAGEGRKPSYIALPIPVSDPTLGSGLTLVGAALYSPNDTPRPWVTGIAAMRTDTGSEAYGAAQQANFLDDRIRVFAVGGKADLNLHFYGIGSAAGDRRASVPTHDVGTFVMLEALYGATKALYFGVRMQDLRIHTTMDLSEVSDRIGLVPSSLELDHRTTSLGPVVEYDTRDNQFYPEQGIYATLRAGFAKPAFGSDVDYRNLKASAASYWRLRPDLVVAGRVSGCSVEGDVPFTELCLYGTQNNLRGYTGGQYRDRYLYAAQAEARWRFAPRWGAVAFGGTGSVAPTFGELFTKRQLPSAGLGLRWLASPAYKVNFSLDFAFTRDDHAMYIYLGEAF